jgi:hypothetical protein
MDYFPSYISYRTDTNYKISSYFFFQSHFLGFFFPLSFLDDIFTKYRILKWQFFPVNTLKISFQPGTVIHTCNPSSLRHRHRRIIILEASSGQNKSYWDPISMNSLGMIVHICNSSYTGGIGRKTEVQNYPGKKVPDPMISDVYWHFSLYFSTWG